VRRALALLALCGLGVSACASTQDKSARLKREGKGLLTKQEGLSVATSNRDVRVLGTAVVHDRFGTAAVVELENTTARDMTDVPLAITVRGAKGRTLYRNDAPGLETALMATPLLPHGKPVVWINNQITAAGTPRGVAVKVGKPKGAAPARVPRIDIVRVRRDRDTDGAFVSGVIANRSKIEQRRLTVFAVARRGGRIVAAGRGVVERLAPAPTRKPVRFTIYFIGDPAGARLAFYAPPVRLS
jgi:hypothetical protein